ncbi:hypothetical protein [Methylobacterium nigriterrae]|uniref:hypothetical protein n=1 Tax=Methylobacterium nigriterrae TaxID=3127512 RepID=UPI003013C992
MIRVSATTADITPSRDVVLGGFWSRSGPVRSTGVDDKLEANLALIDDGQHSVLLVSIDTLFTGPDLAYDLEHRLADRGNRTEVVALATHTHSAPMLDRGKPSLGAVDLAWYSEVLQRLTSAAERAFGRLASGPMVSTASNEINGSVGRRLRVRRPFLSARRVQLYGIINGPNPSAERAPMCRAAVLRRADDSVACAIVSWACHPSHRPAIGRISADYIGFVRGAVRSALGNIPVLFLQGFAGDICAHIKQRLTARKLARRLLRGPVFMVPTLREWEDWAADVASGIAGVVAAAARNNAVPATAIRVGAVDAPLSSLFDGGSDEGTCEARIVSVCNNLRLFMVNAEVSAEYAAAVQQHGFWPVGYLGNVFGYFPTDAQIREGGYEVDRFRPFFGLSGRFTGSNDAVFAALLRGAQEGTSSR